jgi:hypothetical protein
LDDIYDDLIEKKIINKNSKLKIWIKKKTLGDNI